MTRVPAHASQSRADEKTPGSRPGVSLVGRCRHHLPEGNSCSARSRPGRMQRSIIRSASRICRGAARVATQSPAWQLC